MRLRGAGEMRAAYDRAYAGFFSAEGRLWAAWLLFGENPLGVAQHGDCAAAEGNSLRRCGASSLAREPRGRVDGVAREDKIFRPQKIFLLHESYGTRLPREGAAEG